MSRTYSSANRRPVTDAGTPASLELGPAGDTQLLVRPLEVVLHRADRQIELMGNFFIGPPACCSRGHVPLGRGQPGSLTHRLQGRCDRIFAGSSQNAGTELGRGGA